MKEELPQVSVMRKCVWISGFTDRSDLFILVCIGMLLVALYASIDTSLSHHILYVYDIPTSQNIMLSRMQFDLKHI